MFSLLDILDILRDKQLVFPAKQADITEAELRMSWDAAFLTILCLEPLKTLEIQRSLESWNFRKLHLET